MPEQPMLIKSDMTDIKKSPKMTRRDMKSTSQEHPLLHQFDATQMAAFYESCVGKLKEQEPKWTSEWTTTKPMPQQGLSVDEQSAWKNPTVFSSKQPVYDHFKQLARESGEPMILMPNFDYGDILNFERFLQALKTDGINAIIKYKQYLNNKDMRKLEIDLVVVHPKYGVLLFEVKDCDHLDSKRRSRARVQLNNASNCFRSMGRLIFEAKGWTTTEAYVPILDFIALPNVEERPLMLLKEVKPSTLVKPTNNLSSMPVVEKDLLNASSTSTVSTSSQSGRQIRSLNYLIKSDLASSTSFAKWWKDMIVEPKEKRDAECLLAEKPLNKFDVSALNWMMGLISCIRNNSIMPIVCSELSMPGMTEEMTKMSLQKTEEPITKMPMTEEDKCRILQNMSEELKLKLTEMSEEDKMIMLNKCFEEEKEALEKEKLHKEAQFLPAYNVNGEFFLAEHEAIRSLSKVIITSKCVETIRKCIFKQILWLLLNDHQKKISVVCSEKNKPFYEEFFMRQRKIYANACSNVRFYTTLESCTLDGQHSSTLFKKEVETWFFDAELNKPLENVMERCRELSSFWAFTMEEEKFNAEYKSDMESMKVKCVTLKEKSQTMALMNECSLKLPMRIQCDVLVIGDIIGNIHMKNVYPMMCSNKVPNLSSMYHEKEDNHRNHRNHNGHYNNQQQMQQLAFNPSKKFKSIKFLRGGSIDNIRTSLKMHDSIQAQVILMHVGDEDLFKTRSSQTTMERIKELVSLVKEYCPNSFVVLSTLMRRNSRTENIASAEVNKGIKEFCRQTKSELNCFYMLNSHMDPDYHTQEGRTLNNKGFQCYIDSFLYFVDHFMIRNNKQH